MSGLFQTRPRRFVIKVDGDDGAVFVVLGRGREFTTTDIRLAMSVAAEYDRVDPLSCSPRCPVFYQHAGCCGVPAGARAERPAVVH